MNDYLLDWVCEDRLSWFDVMVNPGAVPYLANYALKDPDGINYHTLCSNPEAGAMIREHYGQSWTDERYLLSNWWALAANPSMMPWLEELLADEANFDRISWTSLSRNSEAVPWLKANLSKVSTTYVSMNENGGELWPLLKPDELNWELLSMNPGAGSFLMENLKRIKWTKLSRNSSEEAINLLLENPEKIDWLNLCKNPHPAAMEIVEERLEKPPFPSMSMSWTHEGFSISHTWGFLSMNPGALPILEQNLSKVNWRSLSLNPAIFLRNDLLSQFRNAQDYDFNTL